MKENDLVFDAKNPKRLGVVLSVGKNVKVKYTGDNSIYVSYYADVGIIKMKELVFNPAFFEFSPGDPVSDYAGIMHWAGGTIVKVNKVYANEPYYMVKHSDNTYQEYPQSELFYDRNYGW